MTPFDPRPSLVATEVLRRESPTDAEPICRVVVTGGPSRGAALALVRARSTVGRHPTNDLVLADPRVSAVHLELTRVAGGRVLVHDAGSTNGTWLGEQQITDGVLAPGALICVGDTSLQIEA